LAEGGRPSLSDFVNDVGPRGDERYHGPAVEEHRNLVPFAKLGLEFWKLLPKGFLTVAHLGDIEIPFGNLSFGALVGVVPRVGSLYVSTPAATTISTINTYYKAAGTTTAGNLQGWTMPADNRLTYVGTKNVRAHIVVSMSLYCSTASQVVSARLAKNGTTVAASEIRGETGTADQLMSLTLAWDISLVTSDYVEVFIANHTGTNSLTVQRMTILASALFDLSSF